MDKSNIQTVAVFGGGTIGSGFAAFFALKGLEVNVFEITEESAKYAEKCLQTPIETYVRFGICKNKDDILGKIHITTDPQRAFKDTMFVQECGAEKLETKRSNVALMEEYLPEDAIIASSSSGTPTTKIAEFANHPERILVGHPFNPSYLIPLIEICKGKKTADTFVEQAVEFYKSVDKTPIVLKIEKPGFVANRLAHALWREEIALVTEGVCTLEEADNAVCFGPGLRWGIQGPATGYELAAGALGIRGCGIKFGAMTDAVFADLSNMDRVPDEWPDISGEQIEDVKKDMPDWIGHTNAEIAEFRDYMLIEMLKLHRKL